MTSPTALIADDEAHLRDYLKGLLKNLWPELIICSEASNGVEALQTLQKLRPDFAFLDIKMPGLTGIEVAGKTLMTHIVFVTAYDQYAIKAFETSALDYLLKPVTKERLLVTINRLKQKRDQSLSPNIEISRVLSQLSSPVINPYLQWIKVSKRDTIELISVDDVDYFHCSDKYTSVVTEHSEWVIRLPLIKLEKKIDPDKFWRIHRSTIIRVEAIASFHKTFSGKYLLKLKAHKNSLVVSRRYANLFKAD